MTPEQARDMKIDAITNLVEMECEKQGGTIRLRQIHAVIAVMADLVRIPPDLIASQPPDQDTSADKAEVTDNDPSPREKMLAESLLAVLIACGVLDRNASVSGPELISAAMTFSGTVTIEP